jgi:hypothetical protein
MIEDPVLEDLAEKLTGSRLTIVSYAADMRGFVFEGAFEKDNPRGPLELFLHVQCAWRIELANRIVTGNFDWYEPADAAEDMGEDWDPATGGSLQDMRLREMLRDSSVAGPVRSQEKDFRVSKVDVTCFGDLDVCFDNGFTLRLFPSRSRSESWRLFVGGDTGAHFVWEPPDSDL